MCDQNEKLNDYQLKINLEIRFKEFNCANQMVQQNLFEFIIVPSTMNTKICMYEVKSVILPKAYFADSEYSFAVKLEKCRTTSFANTFVPNARVFQDP